MIEVDVTVDGTNNSTGHNWPGKFHLEYDDESGNVRIFRSGYEDNDEVDIEMSLINLKKTLAILEAAIL